MKTYYAIYILVMTSYNVIINTNGTRLTSCKAGDRTVLLSYMKQLNSSNYCPEHMMEPERFDTNNSNNNNVSRGLPDDEMGEVWMDSCTFLSFLLLCTVLCVLEKRSIQSRADADADADDRDDYVFIDSYRYETEIPSTEIQDDPSEEQPDTTFDSDDEDDQDDQEDPVVGSYYQTLETPVLEELTPPQIPQRSHHFVPLALRRLIPFNNPGLKEDTTLPKGRLRSWKTIPSLNRFAPLASRRLRPFNNPGLKEDAAEGRLRPRLLDRFVPLALRRLKPFNKPGLKEETTLRGDRLRPRMDLSNLDEL